MVRVRIDQKLHTELHGHANMFIAQIAAFGVGVDFHGGASRFGGFQNREHVDLIRRTAADDPSGRMEDAIDVRILHCLNNPSSLFFGGKFKI